jgi:ubiquinol-cytochrome c reductase cytochrome b subunit
MNNNNITQRLYVEDSIFAYFTGLVEGDGWLSVSKNGKYIIFEIGIELNIRDYDMLVKIQQLLKDIGNINTYKKKTKVRFNIRNKKNFFW